MTKRYKHHKLGRGTKSMDNTGLLYNVVMGENHMLLSEDELLSLGFEEVKAPGHFGNGMIEGVDGTWINDQIYFDNFDNAKIYTDMRKMIYKIRQRHSENDGNFGKFAICYDTEENMFYVDWFTHVVCFELPRFSSRETAQTCIDHFGSELDILLSWYNMQRNNQ